MPIIIAEIGSSPAPAWDFPRWFDQVVYTGATAIKAQLFKGLHFPASEREQKQALEFPRLRWGEFVFKAHHDGLKAGASVFDVEAVKQVIEYGDFVKVAAREQDNETLLDAIMRENERTVKRVPVYRSVSDPRILKRGYPLDLGDVILLTIPHYPASLSTALIKVCYAASYFKQDRAWGWSSHTRNILDCWLAAKLGAAVIEKHLAIESTDLEAGHSLLVRDFRNMVERCKG